MPSPKGKRGPAPPASIKVSSNGPYLVSGCVPLDKMEIISDSEGTAIAWHEIENYPTPETYALCRCGKSSNKPFCDGTHAKTKFNGKENANESYLDCPARHDGPSVELIDYEPLCASARFCHRSGGIWELVKKTDNPENRALVLQEAADCPSGRLVVRDKVTGSIVEPSLKKSITCIEDPAGGGLGPYWVKGGIAVKSSAGKAYKTRNRVTLCRCGASKTKPFCDSSHYKDKSSKK